jgi:hypothetical protein
LRLQILITDAAEPSLLPTLLSPIDWPLRNINISILYVDDFFPLSTVLLLLDLTMNKTTSVWSEVGPAYPGSTPVFTVGVHVAYLVLSCFALFCFIVVLCHVPYAASVSELSIPLSLFGQ